jgi:hypothetical protein
MTKEEKAHKILQMLWTEFYAKHQKQIDAYILEVITPSLITGEEKPMPTDVEMSKFLDSLEEKSDDSVLHPK